MSTRKSTAAMVILALMVGLIATSGARAAIIYQPTDATASSEYRDSRTAVKAKNGSGLDLPGLVDDGDPEPATWPGHDNGSDNAWMSEKNDTTGHITFDLGQSRNLYKAHVWNYNESGFTTRGIKDVDIQYSTDDTTYTSLGTFTLSKAPDAAGYKGEDVGFGSAITARYIKFDIQSNQGGSYVGLSEVRFAIPEPATLSLLALSIAALLGRRRRRA